MVFYKKIQAYLNHQQEKDEINRLYNKLNDVVNERDFWKKQAYELDQAYCHLYNASKIDQREITKKKPKSKKEYKPKLTIIKSK